MIKKEELQGKSLEELREVLGADIEAYAIHVSTIETKEEALKEEEELIKAIEQAELALKDIFYKLPEDCEFDGQVFDKQTAKSFVIDSVNLSEVEWPATLGIYELVKFWESGGEEIPYSVYDSTLRVMNVTKFKGKTECHKALVVNYYLGKLHLQYSMDVSYNMYLAALHNALVDHINSFDQPAPEDVPHEV